MIIFDLGVREYLKVENFYNKVFNSEMKIADYFFESVKSNIFVIFELKRFYSNKELKFR